jgi:hypothetical protein
MALSDGMSYNTAIQIGQKATPRSLDMPGQALPTKPPGSPAKSVNWAPRAPNALDLVGPEVEIGWRVTAKARGHGYAPEVARYVLGYALNELRLPQVVADINPANSASLAVAGKLGLRPAGTVGYEGGIVIRYIARLTI